MIVITAWIGLLICNPYREEIQSQGSPQDQDTLWVECLENLPNTFPAPTFFNIGQTVIEFLNV